MKTLKLIEQNWYIYIASYWKEYEVTDEEYNKITWNEFNTKFVDWKFMFEENPKYTGIQKIEKIQEYKIIEKEATDARAKYLTAELLPEWTFKTFKLNQLEEQRVEIETRFNTKLQELISLYWEEIYNEL